MSDATRLQYPAVSSNTVAFEHWAIAVDHALLAAHATTIGRGQADLLKAISQARDLLADGRGERKTDKEKKA